MIMSKCGKNKNVAHEATVRHSLVYRLRLLECFFCKRNDFFFLPPDSRTCPKPRQDLFVPYLSTSHLKYLNSQDFLPEGITLKWWHRLCICPSTYHRPESIKTREQRGFLHNLQYIISNNQPSFYDWLTIRLFAHRKLGFVFQLSNIVRSLSARRYI